MADSFSWLPADHHCHIPFPKDTIAIYHFQNESTSMLYGYGCSRFDPSWHPFATFPAEKCAKGPLRYKCLMVFEQVGWLNWQLVLIRSSRCLTCLLLLGKFCDAVDRRVLLLPSKCREVWISSMLYRIGHLAFQMYFLYPFVHGRDVIWKQPGMSHWNPSSKRLALRIHPLTQWLMAEILQKLIGRLFHCSVFYIPHINKIFSHQQY